MPATLDKAFGYRGDTMNLPVKEVDAAVPFYESILGFRVISRSDTPHRSAVLARDSITMGLAENGGDPTQDGCAFHVTGHFSIEQHGGAEFRVFYVVAPDGLCYWFGERRT